MFGQSNISYITILRKELAHTWYFIWFTSSFILQWDASGSKSSSLSLAKIVSWKVFYCCFDFVYFWFWIPLIKFDLVCCVFFVFFDYFEWVSFLYVFLNQYISDQRAIVEGNIHFKTCVFQAIWNNSKRSWY